MKHEKQFLSSNSKHTIRRLLLVLIFGLFLAVPLNQRVSQAQDPTATPTPAINLTIESATTPTPGAAATPAAVIAPTGNAVNVTFAALGFPRSELRSPIDQKAFIYNIPDRWVIAPDISFIEVKYDLQYQSRVSMAEENFIDVAVYVYYNDELIGSFRPVEGVGQRAQIPIPAEALGDPDNRLHKVNFVYYSGDCEENANRSVMVIDDQSYIQLHYDETPIEIDLANFPFPIVQNLFTQEMVTMVLPQNYTADDLAAAASIAATLGNDTFNGIDYELLTTNQATAANLAGKNIIFIGMPEDNILINAMYNAGSLPTSLNSSGAITTLDGEVVGDEDGVIQEIFAPNDQEHVYVIVTGNTSQAVANAARALSVLSPRYGFVGNLVVVEELRELLPASVEAKEYFTLGELGLTNATFAGVNTHSAGARIFIPYNWQIKDTPALDLSYFHDSSLQPAGSGITIDLNRRPAGSAPIDNTILGEHHAEILLSPDDFIPGSYNTLTFNAVLTVDQPECVLPKLDTVWARIHEDSVLYLPHTEVEQPNIDFTLDDVFIQFISRQDLHDIWFAMPETPTAAELQGLIEIASVLGSLSTGPGYAPKVSMGDVDVDMDAMEMYHAIIIGRPTTNPLLASINDDLPQPFVPGEDALQQEVGNIVYRLPDGFSIGLLQMLPSPWNVGKASLVSSGTTNQGVNDALAVLTGDDLYYEIDYNLAFVNGDRVESFDTNEYVRNPLGPGAEAVTGEKVALETIDATPSAEIAQTPTVTPTTVIITPPDISGEVGDLGASGSRDYTPPQQEAPVGLMIIALIGAGLLVAVLGLVFTVFRKRNES